MTSIKNLNKNLNENHHNNIFNINYLNMFLRLLRQVYNTKLFLS